MKLIQQDGQTFVFHISKREKGLLLEVLKLYPLVPIAHHRVSSQSASAPRATESQRLLESALTDRTLENKRLLLAMLNHEARLTETDNAHRLKLTASQMEWLLQVLNDIRVGSWIILGEPDGKKAKAIELNDAINRYRKG